MAKILVADDEELLREVLVDHLEDEGHEIAEAGNGKEALDAYATFKPDLVISDINMPVMDGFQFLSTLQRKHPEIEDIPFFFLSALSDSTHQLKGLNFGIDEYLCKPVDFDILTARINLSLRRKEQIEKKIHDALTQSMPTEAVAPRKTAGKPSEPSESNGHAQRVGSSGMSLLAGKRPKLSEQRRGHLVAINHPSYFHSASIINKLGRRVGISRLFFKKEKCDHITATMISSEFDPEFYHKINQIYFDILDDFIHKMEHFEQKAIIIPSFFQYMYNTKIRDQHIDYLDYIEDKYCIAIICETIHLPDRLSAYADTLAPLSTRKHVQVLEIRKPNQLQDIDLAKLRVGAISMDYTTVADLSDEELVELRDILSRWEINFYIKEITDGKIGVAQSLNADLLSVST